MSITMASRIRGNNQYGALSQTLLIGGTTLNSPQLASFPAVTGSDIAVLTIDPQQVGGAPEIVYVTAHTASATTATIARGKEGTSARQHSTSEVWINGITTLDLDIRRYRAKITATGATTNLVAGLQGAVMSSSTADAYDPASMVINSGASNAAIQAPFSGDYLVTAKSKLFVTPPVNGFTLIDIQIYNQTAAIARDAVTLQYNYTASAAGGYYQSDSMSEIIYVTAGFALQLAYYTPGAITGATSGGTLYESLTMRLLEVSG